MIRFFAGAFVVLFVLSLVCLILTGCGGGEDDTPESSFVGRWALEEDPRIIYIFTKDGKMQMDLDVPGYKGVYDIGTYSLSNGSYRFVSIDSEIARGAGFGAGEVSNGDYLLAGNTLKLYDEDGSVTTLKREEN